MAERQRPALGTDPLGIERERPAAGQHLPREGLVELDHVDVAERQARAARVPAARRHERQSGAVRDRARRSRWRARAGPGTPSRRWVTAAATATTGRPRR